MGGFAFLTLHRKRLAQAVSLALASLAVGGLAQAQTQQNTEGQAQVATGSESASGSGQGVTKKDDGTTVVTVVGTRRSQQSSIDRKKYAATAQDSIVAADVGSLPDRNVGEAISRIAGIALERGEYGEGINVSVRGNGPELTRVELDGQAVLSPGGADMAGAEVGRATEFRQMSADLIKSVDVVKGSTPDMTEGSLGGGIVIKTRTGLDFDKPFMSLRVAKSQLMANKAWTPDLNLILSRKFMEGRLGVLLNATSTTLNNESHQYSNVSNGNSGYTRAIDLDNSPQKSFTFHPETANMNDPVNSTPVVQSALTGGGSFNSATPIELLTKSAAAQSKADCLAAFPALSAAQLGAMTSTSVRNAAINARSNEVLTCLNQWNDAVPNNMRYLVKRQIDARKNLDLRTDFKVNNELALYAKGSYTRRMVEDYFLTYGLGTPGYNAANTFTDTAAGVRSAVPGSNYYLYPTTYSGRSNTYPVLGATSDIDPSSVVVDANHQVTKFTINDAIGGNDQIYNPAKTLQRYLQLGGTFRRGGLTAEFMIGDMRADFSKNPFRLGFAAPYGTTTATLQPGNIWTYSTPAGGNFNLTDFSALLKLSPATAALAAQPLSATNTVARPAYSIAQQPLTTPVWGYRMDPFESYTAERTGKLDLTYAVPDSIPFLKRIKSGLNLRETQVNSWGGGGYTPQAAQGTFGTAAYVPAVVVPTAAFKSTIVACQDTAGSLGTGGAPCQYGYNPFTNPIAVRGGQVVLTPQQFNDLLAAAYTKPAASTQLFNGASGRPAGLIDNWTMVDIQKVLSIIKDPNANLDCVKTCVGSDGKLYDQPMSHLRERADAMYLMADFGFDRIPFTERALPFGWELDGNIGFRYVRTKVEGTALTTFTSILKTQTYDPKNPSAVGGTSTTVVTRPTTMDATTHDFMPSLNLAMWLVPDKVVTRYSAARTVARPPVYRLLAAASCTYDETRLDQDLDLNCGTMGNPALKPQTNINQNLSVEYYPNKDSMFTLSTYRQHGIIGANILQQMTAVPVFAGSSIVDPASGKALSDLVFDYRTYVNGPALTRTGVEASMKTAFTFLPWRLRFTGLDANYTRQKSTNTSYIDLMTGEALPALNEPKYSYNWAVWYDDGRLSARVAVQAVGRRFFGFGAGGRYYSYIGGIGSVAPTYNPLPANWTAATRYVDGRIAFKFNPHAEFFVEGRNLGNKASTTDMGNEAKYANGQDFMSAYNYSGRRITVGMSFRN